MDQKNSNGPGCRRGFLVVCCVCAKAQDGTGEWVDREYPAEQNSGVALSHGLCPACMLKLYGNESWYRTAENDPGETTNAKRGLNDQEKDADNR